MFYLTDKKPSNTGDRQKEQGFLLKKEKMTQGEETFKESGGETAGGGRQSSLPHSGSELRPREQPDSFGLRRDLITFR